MLLLLLLLPLLVVVVSLFFTACGRLTVLTLDLCGACCATGLTLVPVAARRQRRGSSGDSSTYREQRHHWFPGAAAIPHFFLYFLLRLFVMSLNCSCLFTVRMLYSTVLCMAKSHDELTHSYILGRGQCSRRVLFYHSSLSSWYCSITSATCSACLVQLSTGGIVPVPQ